MHDLIVFVAVEIAQRAPVFLLKWALGWAAKSLWRWVMVQGKEFLSTGQAAKKVGIRSWEVSRLYERGMMPPAARAGNRRIIPIEDLPALREAAKQAGYLK